MIVTMELYCFMYKFKTNQNYLPNLTFYLIRKKLQLMKCF